MDCFQDVCLGCDNLVTDGSYCTEVCRLIELEKASAPSSPLSPTHQPSWASSGFGTGSAYVLAPAYKFPEPARGYSQPSATEDRRPQSSYFMRSSKDSQHESQQSQRSLTPSSSRSSLSSTMSNSNAPAITEQAKQELQEYFNAFDHTRAAKRRQSTW